MSSRAHDGRQLLALRVLLTEVCNLACVFCHNEGQHGVRRDSPIDTAKLLMLLRVGERHSLRQIKFSGGEPTLHPGLPDLVRTSVAAGHDTVVISNGTHPDRLRAVAELGARISLNIPSADPETYRRLTGGTLATVLATVSSLRAIGTRIAINSYARLMPDRANVAAMVDLACAFGCDLKLLLPCQVTSPEKQRRARVAYAATLSELDCTHEGDTPFDSTWRRGGMTVRIVQSWCPTACHAVVHYYRSLRLATDLTLHPCFGGSDNAVPLDFSDDRSCANGLDTALRLTATDCGHTPGLTLIHRRPEPTPGANPPCELSENADSA